MGRIAAEIMDGSAVGKWFIDPCAKCSMRGDISCCGCNDMFLYKDQTKEYREALEDKAFEEAVAIGSIRRKISTLKDDLCKHERELDKFFTPQYDERQKKADVTGFFGSDK